MAHFNVIKVQPTVWVAAFFLWTVASIFGAVTFTSFLPSAILSGFIITLLHWLALFIHHLGHSIAARNTGYPMTGILLWWALATSLYPTDEVDLPAYVHINRALGGPIASLLFAVLAFILAAASFLNGGTFWVFPAFASLDSFLVFVIGSLIPIGFTDGSTLIRWLSSDRSS